MDKKKLGLINKSKLELRKTVGGGTVKQSFSHGRVKSVAVEVKKVRTFDKNSSSQKQMEQSELPKDSLKVGSVKEETKKFATEEGVSKNSSQQKLEKIKEAAHSNKIDMENKIGKQISVCFYNHQTKIAF